MYNLYKKWQLFPSNQLWLNCISNNLVFSILKKMTVLLSFTCMHLEHQFFSPLVRSEAYKHVLDFNENFWKRYYPLTFHRAIALRIIPWAVVNLKEKLKIIVLQMLHLPQVCTKLNACAVLTTLSLLDDLSWYGTPCNVCTDRKDSEI